MGDPNDAIQRKQLVNSCTFCALMSSWASRLLIAAGLVEMAEARVLHYYYLHVLSQKKETNRACLYNLSQVLP